MSHSGQQFNGSLFQAWSASRPAGKVRAQNCEILRAQECPVLKLKFNRSPLPGAFPIKVVKLERRLALQKALLWCCDRCSATERQFPVGKCGRNRTAGIRVLSVLTAGTVARYYSYPQGVWGVGGGGCGGGRGGGGSGVVGSGGGGVLVIYFNLNCFVDIGIEEC